MLAVNVGVFAKLVRQTEQPVFKTRVRMSPRKSKSQEGHVPSQLIQGHDQESREFVSGHSEGMISADRPNGLPSSNFRFKNYL